MIIRGGGYANLDDLQGSVKWTYNDIMSLPLNDYGNDEGDDLPTLQHQTVLVFSFLIIIKQEIVCV